MNQIRNQTLDHVHNNIINNITILNGIFKCNKKFIKFIYPLLITVVHLDIFTL